MNRNEDRWRHCYWKEWPAIKKRWAKLHTTWRERADDLTKRDEGERSLQFLNCDF